MNPSKYCLPLLAMLPLGLRPIRQMGERSLIPQKHQDRSRYTGAMLRELERERARRAPLASPEH